MKKIFLSMAAIIAIGAIFAIYNAESYGGDDSKQRQECLCGECAGMSECAGNCEVSGSCDKQNGCNMTMSEFKKEPMKHRSGMMNTGMSISGDLCPVSGEPIGNSKAAYTYLGKEYKFCCAGCVEEFRSEPIDYVKEEIKCPVEGGAGVKEVSAIYEGTKYYFCCAGCDKEFMSKPAEYLEKMNSSSEK